MMHVQPAIVQSVNQNKEVKEVTNQNDIKTVNVNIINQVGQAVGNYTISGTTDSKVGSKLKDQSQVIQVLNKGEVTSINTLKNATFSELGNTITIMTQEGIGVDASYTINGQPHALPANDNNIVTLNSAKIYVPSSVLKGNKLSSVEIDGISYTGKVEGNYVVVNNCQISPVATSAHKVVVSLQNNTYKPFANEVLSNTKAGVDVIVMNQFGQELQSQNVADANGFTLAGFIANAQNKITSMTYNGNEVTLMDLLTQKYVPGTSNLFVITEYTQAPIQASVNLGGNRTLHIPNTNDTISAQGGKFEIPTGLLRNFNPTSVTINGVEYKGQLEGNSYVVNEFIPSAIQYITSVNLARK